MKYKRIDLHMHTVVSDGTDTLEEIVNRVREAGIDLFSVTDHDSIRGGIEVPKLLERDGENRGLAFIRGVEFSCRDEAGKYHILGYGYDPANPAMIKVIDKGHGFRMEKTRARLDFLKEAFGFEFTEEEIDELLRRDNPGKPHIAKLMIKHGYAETITQAMTDFINKKKLHNVYIRPEEAIEGILKSGGIPVLAHPPYGSGDEMILGEDMNQRLLRLMDFGLAGVEAFYSVFTPKMQAEILGFAEKYDLYVTAGSDYHGENKMIDLGWTNLDKPEDAPAGLRRFLDQVEIICDQRIRLKRSELEVELTAH